VLAFALVSRVGPLGDVVVTLGATGAASSSFVVRTTVRDGLGARAIEIPIAGADRVHVDDVLRDAGEVLEAPPRLALPWLVSSWSDVPGHDRARARVAGEVLGGDPAPRPDTPPPQSTNELAALWAEPPFPRAAALSAAEIRALGVVLPTIRETSSSARARVAADRFAREAAPRLVGTPIAARVGRITAASARALDWSGQVRRAAAVVGWNEGPIERHPIALEILATTALEGAATLPTASFVRARVRAELAAPFVGGGTRRDLLRIELGASIAATLEVVVASEEPRDLVPPTYVLATIARRAADAAVETGHIEPDRALPAMRAGLDGLVPPATLSRAAELAGRSVEKLREAAERAPARAWAVGPLDEPITTRTHFTHGPPR
jgi:hypothetical protein